MVLHKEILLNILDYFVYICEQNNLKYYLAGGSVLGAVRHKEMIPWDDDIDVYMPRKDYQRLQQLPSQIWGKDFRLAFFRNTPNYRYDFIKIELLNTTLIERFHPDYVGGVFLDVFPLDIVTEDEVQRHIQLQKIKRLSKIYKLSYLHNDCDCQCIFELIKVKWMRFMNRSPRVLEKWEEIASMYNEDKENSLIVDYHSPWMHRPMPVSYIGEGTLLEFEGKKYVVPSQYDAYLKHVYGDYMKLPPKEKQVGHAFDYVNYDRRISNDEICHIFNELHKKYSYKITLKSEVKYILKKLHLR